MSAQPARPSRSLNGKVAIVTGAGTHGEAIGNGRAISLLLAEDGARVVCVDLEAPLAERTAQMAVAENNHPQPVPIAVAVQADVSKEDDCKRVVDTALRTYGRVDILVNNVGVIGARGTALEVHVDEWARGLEVNVTSMMLMAKYAVAAMLKNEPAPVPAPAGGGGGPTREYRQLGVRGGLAGRDAESAVPDE